MLDIHNTTKVTYNVVGRYMDGTSVTGYHLVGSDGSQIQASKDRVLFLIGKGLVNNLRAQALEDGMIIRGKGINLNTIPIYDVNKQQLRGENIQKTQVKPKKNSNIIGQLEITKRIMFKTQCLGYVLRDINGKETRISRERVIELGIQRLLTNATVQKYTNSQTQKTQLILRGVGTDLNKIPELIVNEAGKVIDPNDQKSKDSVRITKMNKAGVIHDGVKNSKAVFSAGDYLVCGNKATLKTFRQQDIEKYFKIVTNTKGPQGAICDAHLDKLSNYKLEIFGGDVVNIDPKHVIKWQVASLK